MTHIRDLTQAEEILATYIPQVKELLGKDLTLVRMKPLLEAVGNPHEKLKIIHVAGTSGKTSTTYYIAALLKQEGKKVGHTVSPHVDSITERIQINMVPLSENEFCKALAEFLELIKEVDPKPTYFELMIAFVYWYFAKVGVDYAVMETGLGGSFDATNVAKKSDKVCVITDIGLDHMHVLGKTLPEIAGQKAGIISPGNHVFTYDQSPAVMEVFRATAMDQHAILNVLSVSETHSGGVFSTLPLFQQRNWLLAHQVYSYIAQRDSLPGLTTKQLAETTKLQVPGRMDIRQVAGKTIIMDGAHNEQKMTAFVTSFTQLYPDKKAAVLLSLKEGKEYHSVLPLLQSITSRLIISTFDTAQDIPAVSIDPNVLAEAAKDYGFHDVLIEPNSRDAYKQLLDQPGEIAVITGSFYLLSGLRPLILNP